MQQIVSHFQVFVYLFTGRQEETLPNWDAVKLEKNFQPDLFGRFRDEFVEVSPEPEKIFIGSKELLRLFFRDHDGSVAYIPERPDFLSHAAMVELTDSAWKAGDWIFKLIRIKGGRWEIQGGQYCPAIKS